MSGNAKQRTTLTNLNEPQQMRELNRQLTWIWDQLLGGLSLKSLNSGTRKIIDSKASCEEVDELSGTVEKYGTQIQQSAKEIALKADKTVVDDLGNVVSVNSTAIVQTAEKIEATATEVQTLDDRIAENESKISQTPEEIRLAVESVQIGGRNLLIKTKTLENADSDLMLWQTASAHSRAEGEDGFYQIDWKASGLTADSESALRSPLFKLPDGWMDRKCVLSFWVKAADWAKLDGELDARICLTTGDRAESYRWARLKLLTAGGAAGGDLMGDGVKAGQWKRIWAVAELTQEGLRSSEAVELPEKAEEEEPVYDPVGDYAFGILKQPGDVSVRVGETVTLKIEAAGAVKYQWQNSPDEVTWTDSYLTGCNTDTLSFPMIVARYNYLWRCVITGESGGTLASRAVSLIPKSPITKQPESVDGAVGETVTFTVEADDASKYQWQNSADGATWNDSYVAGYNQSALTMSVVAVRYDYLWRCMVTDANGMKFASDPVMIRKPLADATHGWAGVYVSRNADFSLKAPQLEFGDRPSDWSPSPEDVDEELTRLSAELVVQADEIAMRVTEERLTEAVDGIQVGGTNLLKDSRLLTTGSDADHWRISWWDVVSRQEGDEGFFRAKFEASGLTEDKWGGIASPVTMLPADWQGRKMTLSFWVYAEDWANMNGSINPITVGLCLSQGDTGRLNYGSKNINKTGKVELIDGVHSDVPLENGKWARVSMTWTLEAAELTGGDGDFNANTHVFVQFFLRRNGYFEIYAPKLEFGNKASEWSPAPEDAELKIEKLSAELSVQAGKITANTTAIQTAQSTANSAQTQANANKTNLSNVTTRVTTAEQSISALDGKIASKVEKTAFDALGKEVSRQGTLIEQTAEDVLIQAGRTVGGTNYLRDSADGLAGSAYLMGEYYFSDDLKPKTGENVTIRIWGSLGGDRTEFGIWNTNGYIPIGSLTDNGDGTYSGTFGWKVDSANYPEYSVTEETQKGIQIYALPKTGTSSSTITKIKLERGDYATDWTPHPEEFQAGSSVKITEDEVDISTPKFEVNIVDDDGETNVLTINESGAVFASAAAPNIAPRYDGPAVLYVNPNAASSQIAAGNYFRSLADACAKLNYKWVGKTVTINLAAGMTEYGTVTLQGVSGGCWVQIVGNSANRAKLVGRMNMMFNTSPVGMAYMNIDSDGTAVNIEGCQTASISHGIFTGPGTGVSGTRGVRSARGSQVVVGECEIYDFERSVYGEMGGSISGYSCKGNCRVGVNRTTIYLSGTMPCDSTTWAESIWAGQVITQSITVDQGSKPTPETAPVTTAFNYLYSDSWCAGWNYYDNEDIWQGWIRRTDNGEQAAVYGVIWFDQAAIQSAIGTKTVKQASLRLHMHTGVGRGTAVSVQLYGTNAAYSGRSSQPALTKSYGTIIEAANPGEVLEITIPAAVINDLVSGAIQALVLKSDDTALHKERDYSRNYARFSGTTTATSENCPRLTVVYQ